MPDGDHAPIDTVDRLASIRAGLDSAAEAPQAREPEPDPMPVDEPPPHPGWADQAAPDEGNPAAIDHLLRSSDPGGPDRPTRQPPNWVELSPVQPLGTYAGTFYYLDALGQVRDLKIHGQTELVGLFSPHLGVLHNWWPRYGKAAKEGETPPWVGCKYEEARDDLMTACSRKGLWTPFGRLRGVGAWRGPDGELVLHCGDAVWRGPSPDGLRAGEWLRPQEIDGQVYAAGEAQPRPDPDPSSDRPINTLAPHDLLRLFGTWAWQREVDPVLLLGWIGAAMLGGALAWRPAVWLTGDAGTGKSTLQQVVKGLLGAGLVQSADATGAGIWQVVGMSSLPVAIDELEPSENAYRTKAVVDLARQAASGAVVLRGGQDHQGHQFRAQSAFLFSSILLPPMTQADRSRLAIMELDPLPKGRAMPDLSPRRLASMGAALRGRLVARWPDLHETLERFRAGLAVVGHAARGADQFGTLLAISHLLLYDGPVTDAMVVEACAPLAADQLAETAEKLADWQEWLQALGSTRVDAYKGGNKRTIGRIVSDAAQTSGVHVEAQAANDANEALSTFGLRVYAAGSLDGLDGSFLAVANRHTALNELHAGTRWVNGSWSQSAGRVPGARKWPKALRFAGISSRATLVPLNLVFDPVGDSPPAKGTARAPDDGTGSGGDQRDGQSAARADDAAHFPSAEDYGVDPDPERWEPVP